MCFPGSADLAAARALLPADATPLVVIHPGAGRTGTCWDPAYFADVASRCVRGGALVVLVGAATESELLDDIWRQSDQQLSWGAADVVVVLAGLETSTLRGVLALSDVYLGSDGEVRELAQAVDKPTVEVAERSPDEVMDDVSGRLG